ncbi:unnamed protein product [Phytophthora lilii]|uniref:Unnamed protein product n=1 Tax=Phytophthora lilii TaxID=2077276 RepID=A0A9W6WRD8_9STRA|nr:unnamed protein product [Phytophthora lilii]
MRRYLCWVVATALLVPEAIAVDNRVANAETIADEKAATQQNQPKGDKESVFQDPVDETTTLLRGSAFVSANAPTSEPSGNKRGGREAGTEVSAASELLVVPSTDASTPKNDRGGQNSFHENRNVAVASEAWTQTRPAEEQVTPEAMKRAFVAAPAPTNILSNIVPWSEQFEVAHPDKPSVSDFEFSGMQLQSEERMKSGVSVEDESVVWDQFDCHPCDVPTQPPTFSPTYPHKGNDYIGHLPTVNDELDLWDDLKETNPPKTGAPTEVPHEESHEEIDTEAPRTNTHNNDEYKDHLPTVHDVLDSWDDILENLPAYTGSPTKAPHHDYDEDNYDSEHGGDYADCTKIIGEYGERYECPEDTTEPPEDTSAPTERPTQPPEDTTAPTEGPTHPPEDTNAPTESPTPPPEDTTAPTEGPTQPPEDTNAPTEGPTPPPEDTTAPTEGPTQPPDDTTAPTEGPTPPPDDTTAPTEGPTEPPGSSTAPPLGSAPPPEDTTAPPGDISKPYQPTPAPSEPNEPTEPGEPTPAPSEPTEPGEPTPTPTPAATTPDWDTTYPVTTTKKPGTSTGTTSTTTGKTTTGGSTTMTTGTSTGGTTNASTGTTTTGTDTGVAANTAGTTTSDSTTSTSSSADALSAGAIAGIAIGCAVFVAVVVGSVLFWQKSLARQREENLFADLSNTGVGLETDYAAM